jgi:hypothetical protein
MVAHGAIRFAQLDGATHSGRVALEFFRQAPQDKHDQRRRIHR